MLSLKHKDVFIYNDALVPKARITTVLELNLEKLMDEQITATSNEFKIKFFDEFFKQYKELTSQKGVK